MSTKIIRSLLDVFPILSRGRFVEKCNEHLVHAIETLEALPAEKGTASIDIKLTINFDSGRVDIVPSVKSKLPEEKGFAATALWTHDGGLSVQHPSQFDMFAGPREATPAREAV
jgi:hypothetical protein